MTLIVPGTPEYSALGAKDQFFWTRENILRLQEDKTPDIELLGDLHAELRYTRAKAALADPIWDLTHNISVPDIEGRRTLFTPFPIQQHLFEHLHKCEAANVPVRLLVPKSRRHGVSAIIGAALYIFVARGQGRRAMVVAHNDEDAQTLFEEKYLFTHTHDPLAPVAQRKNVGELYFPEINGRITVRSAFGRRGVGHGGGYHALHLSEASRYPHPEAYELITGLIETVPKAPAFSLIIVESTGYGRQGWFYDECMRSHSGETTDWSLMFLPWFVRHTAIRAFCQHAGKEGCDCLDAITNRAKFVKTLNEAERLLMAEYNLAPERINWYRHTYQEDVKAPTSSLKRMLMKREHPTVLLDCFQSTGNSAFDLEQVDVQYMKCQPPVLVGELVTSVSLYDPKAGITQDTPLPRFVQRENGPLVVWKRPRPGHEYTIGADPAQGKAKGDFAAMIVFDRNDRAEVARFRARIAPSQLFTAVRLLSRWYNNALICPEENSAPEMVENLKKCDRRQHLYWRMSVDRSGAVSKFEKRFAYHMNLKTKTYLVHVIQECLEQEPGMFVDRELLDEMKIFPQELSPSGQVVYPGVPPNSGSHDDLVIAFGLAVICDRDMPWRGVRPRASASLRPSRNARVALTPDERVERMIEASARANDEDTAPDPTYEGEYA